MICTVCEKEAQNGKTYTLSPEAASLINEEPFSYWVCNDCLANPLRRFAETLLSMWDIFPMTAKQKVDQICTMFRSGRVRLPKTITLTALRQELERRAS
jgi:hypothetical protein